MTEINKFAVIPSFEEIGPLVCAQWMHMDFVSGCVSSSGPPLLYSGHSSWLQTQVSGFDSGRYHVSSEVVGLERSPLSLVSTIEDLLERKSSCSGLQNRECGRRGPAARTTWYPLSAKVKFTMALLLIHIRCNSLHKSFSVCCVFTGCHSKASCSSSAFTSVRATDCLRDPHDPHSWTLPKLKSRCDWRSVSQSVCLGPEDGTYDHIFVTVS
jgi:hypothetical protein